MVFLILCKYYWNFLNLSFVINDETDITNIFIMNKIIRMLEIPIYLLVIAMAVYEIEKAVGVSVFLVLVSIARLFTNIITDEFIYKR